MSFGQMLSDKQLLHFAEKGYVVYEHALSRDQVEALHQEADILLNHILNQELDLVHDLGCIIEPLACGYIDCLPEHYRANVSTYTQQRDLILDNTHAVASDLLFRVIPRWSAQLLRSDTIYLLNEQYIIKPPSSGSKSSFRWHTDGEYLPANEQHINSVACWTALDDVNEVRDALFEQDNGSLIIRPMDGSPEYTVKVPSGSIVFLSNKVVHKSTANGSRRFRRAFMPQYSSKATSVGQSVDVTAYWHLRPTP
ncbi:hypothetical protein Unana1_08761 [Umbelopsis nana]